MLEKKEKTMKKSEAIKKICPMGVCIHDSQLSTCVASECMAWIETPPYIKTDSGHFIKNEDLEAEPEGYCGMVRRES